MGGYSSNQRIYILLEERQEGSSGQMPVVFCIRIVEAAIEHFHLHLTGQNSVAWSHLDAREAGKLSLFHTTMCSDKIWAFSWRKKKCIKGIKRSLCHIIFDY